jgi:hypothetical protein
MHEFDTVSSSSAADLARALTQRSADGWEVVSIVANGADVTAFVRRETTSVSAMRSADMSPQAASTSSSTTEPAGWGSEPAGGNGWASNSSGATSTMGAAATTAAATAPARSGTVPQVPAGWYADPAGRYELRYWDGGQWTEHVARGGTQFTDPPVA